MIEFNKNTVFECYLKLVQKGLHYTLSYYQNELKRVPETGVYLHIKPGYEKLVLLLKEIKVSSKTNMLEIKVGEGPINDGEYWGTFVDYVIVNNYYDILFNNLIEATPFSASPIINYDVLKSRISTQNYRY